MNIKKIRLSRFFFSVNIMFLIMLNVLSGCSDESEFSDVEISLNKSELYLEVGKSERLIASFNPFDAPNQAHKWASNDPHIAMVDETGKVKAVHAGKTVVMARAMDGGSTAKCNVTVVDKIVLPNLIELNSDVVNLVVGESFELDVAIKPSNATDKTCSFKSLDEDVASVDEKGVITANSFGDTEIEIITNSANLKAVCKVSVKDKGVVLGVPVISNVTDVSADVHGELSVYGVSLKEAGICYSSEENFDIHDNKVLSVDYGTISCQMEDLAPETTYNVRSYIIDKENNVMYSDKVSFTTNGVLKTNFQPEEVYEDRLRIISDAPKGYKTVNFCYGTTPKPKVTDYISTASLYRDTGMFTAYLQGLKANTTYYIRSYHEEEGKIIYHDDEVEISTLGDKNISKSGTPISNPKMKYRIHNTYYVEYIYTFKTKLEGEFYIELASNSGMYMTNESTLTKSNKVRSLYFSNEVTLIFQVGGGSDYYNGARLYCGFNRYRDNDSDRNITLTHIQTGIKYIYNIKMGDISFMVSDPYSGVTYIKEGENK